MPVEPVGSINKNMCGAKLLATTVLAYVHFCHLRSEDTALLSVSLGEDITHCWLPTTHHPLHLLIYAIRDITVVVKKVAENPAVLAIQQT